MANSSGNRNGGIFFVAGALVIAVGVIGYLTTDSFLRRDRPAAAAPAEATKPPATTPQ